MSNQSINVFCVFFTLNIMPTVKVTQTAQTKKKAICLIVALVALISAILYVFSAQSPQVDRKTVELFCSDQNAIHSACTTAFEHVLAYIQTHMSNARIVGRRFRYLPDANVWLIGVYIINEQNERKLVYFDPRSGEVVVSSPD